MKKLKLLIYPNPRLRRKCAHLLPEDVGAVAKYVAPMRTIMRKHNGAALAAPQVDIPKRFFVTKNKVYINPKWVVEDPIRVVEVDEGCLSFPGLFIRKERFWNISVEYMDLEGKIHNEQLEGFDAQVVQHETDHLDGRLLIDNQP